ncbi:hypothetical protein M8J77_018243 [Diaphorina citri]|nr:hypothetical protein M8J77_018243 [Diaphorina citri]
MGRVGDVTDKFRDHTPSTDKTDSASISKKETKLAGLNQSELAYEITIRQEPLTGNETVEIMRGIFKIPPDLLFHHSPDHYDNN